MPESMQPTSASPELMAEINELFAKIKAPSLPEVDPVISFRATEEGQALIKWAKSKFQKAKAMRQKYDSQWSYNLAMFNGNQWVEPLKQGVNSGLLATPLMAKNMKDRRTINRIKPICRTEMAKFISQRPGASVIPATDEDEDILAAEAGEQVWQSTADRRHLDDEFRNAVFWMVITGNGFMKTKWDPQLMDSHAEVPGDIEYASVDPYKLFFGDLKVHNLQDQPFIIHAYAKSTDWIKFAYADALEGIDVKSSCAEQPTIEAASYANLTLTDEKAYDANMLYEVWVKPGQCRYLPDGGMLVLVDDILVEYHSTFPYDHGEYPFSHAGHVPTGDFYCQSVIEELIDLQKDFNKLRSQIAESRRKMGKPQMMAPKGSITASKMTDAVGLLIEYKLGMQPPQAVAPVPIPQYILQEVEYIIRDFEDISGQHEVSKGQTPPGVSAATAIGYLQESDDSYILPSFKNIESMFGSVARQTIQLQVQYWEGPRLVKIVGKDDTFSTKVLSGADLKRATDIRIEPGSGLPESKAARQALIMDLMTNGFVDPNEGLDMMEVGAAKKLIDTIKNDKRQAQRENIKMKRVTEQDVQNYQMQWDQQLMMSGVEEAIDPETGQPLMPPLLVPVNDYDNHEVHIEEHNRFRRTQEFENLPEVVKQLFQSHVEQHKVQMQNSALEQMLAGIPSDGTTPGITASMDPQEVDLTASGGGMEAPDPDAAPGAPISGESNGPSAAA